MSVSEIAECMNCPEGTVTYRLSSARGKIKHAVQKYEDTSGVSAASSAGMTAAKKASKLGIKGLIKTTKAKIYDKGYIPDKKETRMPIEEKFWSLEDCIVELNMDYGTYSNETYMLDPHSTQISCINHHDGILNIDTQEYLKVDRDPRQQRTSKRNGWRRI